MQLMERRPLASVAAPFYLVMQGVMTALWWVLLTTSETFRGWFMDAPLGWGAARTIILADCIVFGLGSIVAGLMLYRAGVDSSAASTAGASSVGRVLWAVVGAAWYATLVSVLWVAAPVGGWVGVVVMIPAATATTLIALQSERSP